MSHTEKDAPDWVQILTGFAESREWHRGCPQAMPPGDRPCDIDDARGRRTIGHCWRSWYRPGCRYYYTPPPRRQIRRLFYYKSERAQIRAQLEAARRDWNTCGDTDIDPPGRQHRHSPWGGGWWD
jgi:hypothetical protein